MGMPQQQPLGMMQQQPSTNGIEEMLRLQRGARTGRGLAVPNTNPFAAMNAEQLRQLRLQQSNPYMPGIR